MFSKAALTLVALASLASADASINTPRLTQKSDLQCNLHNPSAHCVVLGSDAYTLGVTNKDSDLTRYCTKVDDDHGKGKSLT